MSNNDSRALVPKLRFPEFRGDSAWRVEELGSVCDILNNRRQPISSVKRRSGSYPYYGASGIVDYVDEYVFDERLVLVGEDGAKWGPFEATAFIAEGKYWVNNHAHVLKPKKVNDTLLVNYLTKVDLGPYVTGAAPPKLTLAKLKAIPVTIPLKLSEQEKIAACLSSLGAQIAAEVKKLEALNSHKMGLRQQLFPAEGETVPRLRFPEFRGSEEWKLSPISHYIEEYREKSTVQDEYEVLTSARRGLIRQREYYDNDRIAERDNIGFNVIPPNYLTYRSRSDDRRFYFNENRLEVTGIISIYYPVFRIVNGINSFFIELLSHHARLVGRHSVGTSQTVLSLNELRRVNLAVPGEAEQRRVADALSAVDDLVAVQAERIEQLKRHKNGLVQQLFPVLVERAA